MKNIYLLLLIILSIGVSAQEVSVKSIKTKNYQMSYTSDWAMNQNQNMNGGFFLFSKETGENDLFRENVNLVVENQPKGLTLKQFALDNVAKLESSLQNFEIVESKMKKLNNNVVYVITYNGTMGFVDLTWEQLVYPKKDKLYILTTVCETTKVKEYEVEFKQMLNSFIFE